MTTDIFVRQVARFYGVYGKIIHDGRNQIFFEPTKGLYTTIPEKEDPSKNVTVKRVDYNLYRLTSLKNAAYVTSVDKLKKATSVRFHRKVLNSTCTRTTGPDRSIYHVLPQRIRLTHASFY